MQDLVLLINWYCIDAR